MIIKIINNRFVYDFYPMRWFKRLFIIRPKQAWERCEIFRFRRELHYQLPPIREIFYDYQLNLMSFVKTHPRHTGEIQCRVFGPRILHRHTYSVSQHNVSTAVFHPTAVEHFQTYCLQASALLFFNLEKGVGSIMTKWMKPQEHKKQTLTFLHTVLPTWEQTAKSSKCPTAPSMNYRIR